jgi:Spy/CpxP family protein refolding chaperone
VKIWKVVIAVILIFGAGVVTGGLLVRLRVPPRPTPAGPVVMGSPAAIPPGKQMFVQRVRRELDLTADQSAQVDEIMRDSHKRMVKIYEPVAPQAREETRRVRQEIQAILTPEQKKKFNEVFKRHQRENSDSTKTNAAQSNATLTPLQTR